MFRKVALALLLLAVAPQIAAAGNLKFALKPVDAAGSGGGTVAINNGKPSDTSYRVHMSVSGLQPNGSYYLHVNGPNGRLWELGFWADDTGACTVRGSVITPLESANEAEVADGMSQAVILIGK